MESPTLRFAIFGNEYQAHKSAAIQKILSFLKEQGAKIYIDRAFDDFLVHGQHLRVDADLVFDGDDFHADYAISMGGDGTFLKAASRVAPKGIPIIGINMGRLGFLADVLPSEIEAALEALFHGDVSIEEHAMIELHAVGSTFDSCPYALNDIAVLKRDNASMISIRATVNGEYVVTYQADGVIVSTPTGSTAYSLSNGGPIIVPQTGILCMTPVAPHSLSVRPIVLADDSEIMLEVESRTHNYLVAIDGRSARLPEDVRVVIRRAPFAAKIVKQLSTRYFSTLREKMLWGADQR